MARFDFLCRNCDHTFEMDVPLSLRDDPVECPACEMQAVDRLFSPPQGSAGAFDPFKPYVEIGCTWDPVLVTSREHRDRLLRETGFEYKTMPVHKRDPNRLVFGSHFSSRQVSRNELPNPRNARAIGAL